MTASPSEGFTEMEDLEDGTDDNLSFVSNPNPTQSVEASLPPVEARDRLAKSPLATESWASRSQIYHGVTLQNIRGNNPSFLPFASKPVAIPQHPASAIQILSTDIIICSTSSHEKSAFLRLGLSKGAAQEAIHWINILEGTSNQNAPTSIYVSCRRNYSRILVTVDTEDLHPHPDFVTALEEAMKKASQDEGARALRDVFRRWGAVIPTAVELGCALVSTTTFGRPDLDHISDNDRSKLRRHAEEQVEAALQFKIPEGKPFFATKEDTIEHEALARRMRFKAVGGTTNMQLSLNPDPESLENPALWTIIGVNGVYSTLELLRNSHSDLYIKCRNIVAYIMAAMATSIPKQPILVFPGRLTAFRRINESGTYKAGFLDLDVPNFDILRPFTLSGWILNGRQIGVNAALSIECKETPYSLVQIGGWSATKKWKALRRLPQEDGTRWLVSESQINLNKWQHVTHVQTRDQLLLFVDGILVAHSTTLPVAVSVPVSQLRLCIGRAAFNGEICDQWDGAIENVKLWDHALSSADILQQANMQHRPNPGGWGAPRYV